MTTHLSVNTDPQLFHQLGYCVCRDVLAPGEIERAQDELARLIEGMPAEVDVFSKGETVRKRSRPEYLTEPHAKHPYWLELCRHPFVLDAVESVLGPNLILIMSHLIVKPAHEGLAVKWHQDNTYWPSVHGTDIVTVWLAIDDADQENGCMKVIPCTHEGYREMDRVLTDGSDLLGVETPVTPEMEAQAAPIELKAGSLSMHDSYVLHGSDANRSDRRRAVYTMRYANALTTRVDTDKHWVGVYLVRGKGGPNADRYIDIRPGKALPKA